MGRSMVETVLGAVVLVVAVVFVIYAYDASKIGRASCRERV